MKKDIQVKFRATQAQLLQLDGQVKKHGFKTRTAYIYYLINQDADTPKRAPLSNSDFPPRTQEIIENMGLILNSLAKRANMGKDPNPAQLEKVFKILENSLSELKTTINYSRNAHNSLARIANNINQAVSFSEYQQPELSALADKLIHMITKLQGRHDS